jgi:hypothetical protein
MRQWRPVVFTFLETGSNPIKEAMMEDFIDIAADMRKNQTV